MQMESVETKAGTAICAAPSRIACSMLLALFQIAVDVLDLDRRIVHQNADGQRKAAQRHDVDGLAQRAQQDERDQDGQAESTPR